MNDTTQWFAECRWGVFCHWLGAAPSSNGGAELTAESWNRRVDAFDVEGLACQLESVGAPYFFITIGRTPDTSSRQTRRSGRRSSASGRRDGGTKVSGWWIDGCYFADEMYRHEGNPSFRSFTAALKAGNPNGIVAFNPGVVVPADDQDWDNCWPRICIRSGWNDPLKRSSGVHRQQSTLLTERNR
jgi:hypothetical protein